MNFKLFILFYFSFARNLEIKNRIRENNHKHVIRIKPIGKSIPTIIKVVFVFCFTGKVFFHSSLLQL